MSTHSDRYGSSSSKRERRKKKAEYRADERRSTWSPTNGHQGEKGARATNDDAPTGKTDTLSSPQSINENKESARMSPTMSKSSDKKSRRKNDGKTIKTTEAQEESRSASTSSAAISTQDTKIEEAASSCSNPYASEPQDAGTATMKKRKSSTASSDSVPEPVSPDCKTFPIHKGDAQHLTDFQLEKAKYFFNVNLDIENKEYVTWEDVEFYLLFHATAAGKEGSDGGELEARLNQATKTFWNHVHEQVPLDDGKRDTLTLNQFLDTWAGLIDYVVRTNQLPPIVQDLVKLGFELYSTENGTDKSPTVQPTAFDQLFQKMNIGRPYAIMAFKYLTENGTKPLDTDKIDSLVKAVITSSDDEHDSHFLLPGFFKTISNSRNNDKDANGRAAGGDLDDELSQGSDGAASTSSLSSQTPTLPSRSQLRSESAGSIPSPIHQQHRQQAAPPPPPPPPPQQFKPTPTSLPHEQQKPSDPSSSPYIAQPNRSPSSSLPRFQPATSGPSSSSSHSPMRRREHASIIPNHPRPHSQNSVAHPPLQNTSAQPQHSSLPTPPRRQYADIQREDENIRSLLRYYHIDDGDVFEVADGPVQRLVLTHPERPIPAYLQQEKQNLSNPQPAQLDPSVRPNGIPDFLKKPLINERPAAAPNGDAQHKPRIINGGSLRETKPRIPQEPTHSYRSSPILRSTFSDELTERKEDWQKKVNRSESHSLRLKKKFVEDSSFASDISSSRQEEKRTRKDRTSDDEEKIVASVLKHLAPIVEKRVAEELRRIDDDETDLDEDDGFIPFPFMLAAGVPFFGASNGRSTSQEGRRSQEPPAPAPTQPDTQPTKSGQEQKPHQTNGLRGADFGGAAFIPPPLFMAMMSDFARAGSGAEMPNFGPNMTPPTRGPAGAPVGVEGFMMFVDDNQMMDGPSGFSARSMPRF